ncbi:MAG: glycosyltransferase, partial [Spirosomaceae bacterium]|nr:glycosyltransferase [Spirosomataceae bacterium]
LWLMLRQNKLNKIFILNDHSTAAKLNTRFSTNLFTYLPDPIYDYPNDDSVLNIREKHDISTDRIILLCFGMIDAKKNVALIIDAAKELPDAVAKKLCILVVGKVREEYTTTLTQSINIAKKENTQLQIEQVNGFVTDAEMESYVKQSDWISLAYVNFYSSSGVVGLAARHNKPILATQFGVIGQQTQEYGLGISVDARKIAEITSSLEIIVSQEHHYPRSAERFVNEHSPENFIKCLLQIQC